MQKKMEFLGFRNGYYEIVTIGLDWFYYRKNEKDLPKKGAWCRECKRESAKPIYPIYMNGREAYALKCPKCGGEYPMYKSLYIQRYTGYNLTSGGRIHPTHGTISRIDRESMDSRARKAFANIPKQVEKDICNLTGMSNEEYKEMRKNAAEKRKRYRKKFKNELAAYSASANDRRIQNESDERKELIHKGVLKYIKGVDLVNTQTNEIVKF